MPCPRLQPHSAMLPPSSQSLRHRPLAHTRISRQLTEVYGTGHRLGCRLPKSQAWTTAPRPVRLGPPPQVSRQPRILSPGGLLFVFLLCCGPPPPAPPRKYFPDLDSKNLTSRTQSLVSRVPHSPNVLLLLRKFQLLILPNSLQSGSTLRGECFFSSPGVSFQVE